MDRPRSLVYLSEQPVTKVPGVGEGAAGRLDRAFDIRTVLDLLTHYPRRWIDRTRGAAVAELLPDEEAVVLVTVRSMRGRRLPSRRGRGAQHIVEGTVTDGTGQLKLTFFGQPWRERQLPPGTHVALFGKVDVFRGQRQMTNPVVDLVGDQTGVVVPLYPQSEKENVGSADTARWVQAALDVVLPTGGFLDPVPPDVLERFRLVDRSTAFDDIHRPHSMADQARARTRLVFDELLRVQLALVMHKRELERTVQGLVNDGGEEAGPDDLVHRFHRQLPFELTGAQRNAIHHIEADLASNHPMHRLLQGDVGAGKTVVALTAMLVAVQSGRQAALMAPTEVLAEQHAASIRGMIDGLTLDGPAQSAEGVLDLGLARPVTLGLLTNRTPAAERRRLAEGLERGDVHLLVGTHALIEDAVRFRSLGVVVIDEQHRFGVEQRAALRSKGVGGAAPDVLVMTATPIPRTAAMTVYGDLDISVLAGLPPGRTPITTRWVRTPAEGDHTGEEPVWEHVRAEVGQGRQAYVVCPLIDESEKLEARSAQETFDRLTAPDGELDGLRVALLHGRLPAAEKEDVMERFRAGEVQVLVATTVIEVGVDVPNATVMVVLDADRFGLAQLHQLRGRVGRAEHASTCWLVGAGLTDDGEARLEAMVRSADGFELAEIDLELRGEGTIMGERQKGRNELKLASIRRDRVWVERAREVAFELVDVDPELEGYPALRDEVALFLDGFDQEFLLKS